MTEVFSFQNQIIYLILQVLFSCMPCVCVCVYIYYMHCKLCLFFELVKSDLNWWILNHWVSIRNNVYTLYSYFLLVLWSPKCNVDDCKFLVTTIQTQTHRKYFYYIIYLYL